MQEPLTKRARVEAAAARATCGRFASSYALHVRDSLHASAFRAAGLSIGARIQVLWSVQRDAADGEPEDEEDVWWSCSVEGATTHGVNGRPAYRLRYDPSDELGFDEETRDVAFLGACGTLLDLQDGAQMPWRVEDGEETETDDMVPPVSEHGAAPPGVIPPGTHVKAHFQGGERAYAGLVHKVRCDSDGAGSSPRVLYDILYEDHVLEEGVPADLVQRAARALGSTSPGPGAAASGDDDIAATSIDEFFGKFVAGLTGGKAFGGLCAARKAAFAECVQRSRPHFEAELHRLAADRGYGTTVTAEDITGVILPRVLPRVVAEFKALPLGVS
ncbi:hypothetical protein KFE25_006701 [Diacronema lutheri]|uniref:Uncharacterized protein n=1 Tax=Diacronema lutheri TaxID=2081491 RepID=A0A8J6CCK4_DIALT|nr:hypothetical protein KFE25_006701 [Diacronema lutheri]